MSKKINKTDLNSTHPLKGSEVQAVPAVSSLLSQPIQITADPHNVASENQFSSSQDVLHNSLFPLNAQKGGESIILGAGEVTDVINFAGVDEEKIEQP